MKHPILPILLTAGLLVACSGQKKTTNNSPTGNTGSGSTSTDAAPAKEPAWAPKAPKYAYQPSRERQFDLLHTQLDVRFDWAKTHLLGVATLTLKPYFFPQKNLVLDAKGFEVHKVGIVRGPVKYELKYDYDGAKLNIDLGKQYAATDTLQIIIDYTAKPNEVNAQGSAAIQGAKGLYFINADKSDPSKPQQIWTQGETEASSCWFPTIDAPNERGTQEIAMTVEKRFVTLSNGVMISSKENGDGTRTDVWRQSLPHAPYLAMMAVGEFAVVKDTPWRGREVSYYVEPEFAPYAKLIFGNTPEMLEFYSNRLGVEYPWEKFSQVVVRDFVSGAMENTTAVVHFGALQHNSREHLDATYEGIIAHELFHHWFGDLVTCESWSNLPLNESFATYGEYLWDEHKYGWNEASATLDESRSGYLAESQGKREQLIRYRYEDKEDMFDGHSYNKGGAVLHLLRNEVGDDAFFASLQRYLSKNAYTDGEIDELRMAFEEVTGRDMHWFFDQWFLSPGHPELSVEYSSDKVGQVSARVRQNQDLRYMPTYNLPITFESFADGKATRHSFRMTTLDTTYVLNTGGAAQYVCFDPDKVLLARISEKRPKEEYVAQLENGKGYMLKHQAMEQLMGSMDNEQVASAMLNVTHDKFWRLRRGAFNKLEFYTGATLRPQIRKAAAEAVMGDSSAAVRGAALDVLMAVRAEAHDPAIAAEIIPALEKAMGDSSYSVQSRAWKAMVTIRKDETLAKVRAMGEVKDPKTAQMIAGVLMTARAPESVDFIKAQMPKWQNNYGKYSLLIELGDFLETADATTQQSGINLLMDEGANNATTLIRLGALRALAAFKDRAEVNAFFVERKEKDTSDRVKQYLGSLLK